MEALLGWWFAHDPDDPHALQADVQRWFGGGTAVDRELAQRFGDDTDAALAGDREHWAVTPRGRLALILLLDQLPRNLFRGTPRAYAGDPAAQRHAMAALERGDDAALHPVQRAFVYMPLEHAEDAALQARSVAVFEALREDAPPGCEAVFDSFVDYARRHRDTIERFGRFPARNDALGRRSTATEVEFLAAHPEGF